MTNSNPASSRQAWRRHVVVALALILGGWMVFDGVHAIVTGDFVTPSEGDYAGQLGPWSNLVEAAGIPARSAAMKAAHVGVGGLLLAAMWMFALRARWGRRAMILGSIAALWYLPFGTLIGVVVLVLVVALKT